MAKKTYYYFVKNRSSSIVKYMIPEDNITRRFTPGETKRLPYEELLHLSYQAGGKELMLNFLQIQSADLPASLGIKTEPEYYMSEADVVELLKHGSLDAFLDCLDFAPEGVIELVKKFSMELPLADYEKRQALKAKTGFDVDTAIANAGKEADAEIEERKIKEAAAPAAGRRTTTNYKVVNQG